MNKIKKLKLKQIIKQYNIKHIVSFSDLSQLKENYGFQKGIYMIFFIDEAGFLHFYIRSAIDLQRRVKEHIRAARNGSTACKYLYNSRRLHGIENFSVGILILCPDMSLKELRDKENELIISNKSTLNIVKGDVSKGTFTNNQAKPIGIISILTLELMEFPSLSAAGRFFQVCNGTLIRAIKKKYTLLNKYKVYYLDNPLSVEEIQAPDVIESMGKFSAQPVIATNVSNGETLEFTSMGAAGKHFNLS